MTQNNFCEHKEKNTENLNYSYKRSKEFQLLSIARILNIVRNIISIIVMNLMLSDKKLSDWLTEK